MVSRDEFELFKQRYFSGLEIWGNKLDAMFASRAYDIDGNVLIDEFVDLVKYVFVLLEDRRKRPSPEESKEWWEEIRETEQAALRDNLVMLTRDSPEDIIGNMMLQEMT